MYKIKTIIVAAVVALLVSGGASLADDTFSWTGSYEGMFVCDQVADGKFGTIGRSVKVGIVQTGTEIDMALDVAIKPGKPEPTSYHGSIMFSPRGDVTTGYVEPCRESFAFEELVRFFPASAVKEGFALTADSIFVSRDLPGLEGKLVLHACKLSITRTSAERPSLRTCKGQ